MNYVTNTSLLVSSSVRSKQLLCFVHCQGQKREQKHTTKNFAEFHNHSPLLTMLRLVSICLSPWNLTSSIFFPYRDMHTTYNKSITDNINFNLFVTCTTYILHAVLYNTYNTYILLTKREGRTGRISARGLNSADRAQRGPYKKDRGPILSQYGPEQAWLIRDLLYDCMKKALKVFHKCGIIRDNARSNT